MNYNLCQSQSFFYLHGFYEMYQINEIFINTFLQNIKLIMNGCFFITKFLYSITWGFLLGNLKKRD